MCTVQGRQTNRQTESVSPGSSIVVHGPWSVLPGSCSSVDSRSPTLDD